MFLARRPRAVTAGLLAAALLMFFSRKMPTTTARLPATRRGPALGLAFSCRNGENSLSPHVTKASRPLRSLYTGQNENLMTVSDYRACVGSILKNVLRKPN